MRIYFILVFHDTNLLSFILPLESAALNPHAGSEERDLFLCTLIGTRLEPTWFRTTQVQSDIWQVCLYRWLTHEEYI